MQKTDPLVGQRFGRLLVLKPDKKKLLCFCSCGTKILLSRDQLLSGKQTSCGCGTGLPPPNLIRNRYGRLVVKKWNRKTKLYSCVCDCGTEISLTTEELLQETTRSCGCLETTSPIIGQQFGLLTPTENEGVRYKCICKCGNEVWVSFDDLFWGTITSCDACKKEKDNKGDLTNCTFGQITIIRSISRNFNGNPSISRRWLARCSCGNEFLTRTSSLRNNNPQSCGCIPKVPRISPVGEKRDRLTIIEEVAPCRNSSGHRLRQVLCRCDCGNLTVALLESLKPGKTCSCGCFNLERREYYNLTGQKIGKLTVLSEARSKYSKKHKRIRRWNVMCECGKRLILNQDTLVHGKPTICGCARQSRSRPSALAGNNKHQLILPFPPESE